MTDDINNIVLEYLRAISVTQARHDEKFDEVLQRLVNLERGLTSMKVDLAVQQKLVE